MAWKDLTINEKARLMNIFRSGGVVSLNDMRRIYDQSLQPSLVETPYSNAYAGGGYIPSDDIKDYIKKTEAFRSNWYNDGNGIPTVGYGFTGKKVKELYPDGMTRAQADAYFDDLINRSAARMSQLTPNMDRLTQNQQDALFSYFYNIGEGNYSKGSPKMQQALQDFDLGTVVENIDAGYNDTRNPGLKKRRDYERALFQKDIVSPLQREPLPVVKRYMYDEPETQLPLVRTPYKANTWSLANPFMYTPEEEYFAKGGKIHIKKKNRGKFTALKKRTGHSASWFKAHGTPAQKKMAVFALNSRKWRHSHGGIIF